MAGGRAAAHDRRLGIYDCDHQTPTIHANRDFATKPVKTSTAPPAANKSRSTTVNAVGLAGCFGSLFMGAFHWLEKRPTPYHQDKPRKRRFANCRMAVRFDQQPQNRGTVPGTRSVTLSRKTWKAGAVRTRKGKKPQLITEPRLMRVVRAGIEPATHGFSAHLTCCHSP